MGFKGTLPIGARVKATLSLDADASAPALLMGAFAGAGMSTSDSDTVAPAATEIVVVTAPVRGILRVVVDMSSQSDPGQLDITANGTPIAAERITGDRNWAFIVA